MNNTPRTQLNARQLRSLISGTQDRTLVYVDDRPLRAVHRAEHAGAEALVLTARDLRPPSESTRPDIYLSTARALMVWVFVFLAAAAAAFGGYIVGGSRGLW